MSSFKYIIYAFVILVFTVYGIFVVLSDSALSQTTWYVDDDNCPGPGTGIAGDPFCIIQMAIDTSVAGDTIVVTSGSYVENLVWDNKDLTITGSGTSSCVINGGSVSSVIIGRNLTNASSLDGFTLTGGTGTPTAVGVTVICGGGIHLTNASPSITSCHITGNTATDFGGGVYCSNSSPTISDNKIAKNSTLNEGGAIYCRANASPIIAGNDICGNSANNGGAIYTESSLPIVSYNTISDNTATNWGGAIFCVFSTGNISKNTFENNHSGMDGGGIALIDSSPAIMGNYLSGNAASDDGGAMQISDLSDPIISRNTIVENMANDIGGAISINDDSSPDIVNNTILGNSSPNGGGIGVRLNCNPTIHNNIISSSLEGAGIYTDNNCNPTVVYNDVWGNAGGGYGGDLANQTGLNGNISADPVFIANAPPYFLRFVSPCRDAGDPAPAYNDPDGTQNDMGALWARYVTGTACGSIQAALDVAVSGETVLVPDGIYCENIVWPGTDGISLRSEGGRDNCIIESELDIFDVQLGRIIAFDGIPVPFTSKTQIIGFTIRNGWALNPGDTNGGGILCINNASPFIAENRTTGNSADGNGGAIACINNSSPEIADNIFQSDIAGFGCELYMAGASSPLIYGNTIRGGYGGGDGSGIYCTGANTDPIIVSNMISGMVAGNGGGIYCGNSSSPQIINNTITNCYVDTSGAGIYSNNSSAEVHNNVIAINSGSVSGGGIFVTGASVPTLSYNDVWGNGGGDYVGIAAGPNDISVNPMFANPGIGDYHLLPLSPCIDIGSNSAVPVQVTTDFEGDPRILDCYGDGTTIVDMGADEALFVPPPEVWVDDDWAGLNYGDPINGHTYGLDAFDVIQDGILMVAASGTVHVASGTYTENVMWQNKDLSIIGSGPSDCIINGGSLSSVIIGRNLTANSLLQGFTITAGAGTPTAAQGGDLCGGGLHLTNSDLHVTECILADNSCVYGGGIYSTAGNLTLADVTFNRCYADWGSGGGFCNIGGSPIMSDISFLFCRATMGSGGGMYHNGGNPVITGASFRGNYSSAGGGGLYTGGGPTILNSRFSSNWTGDYGGGGGIFNSSGNPVLVNVILDNNAADYSDGGGGMANSNGNPILTNVTICNNTAKFTQGGGFYNFMGTPTLTNCVLWGNTQGTPSVPSQILNAISIVQASYCDIEGGYPGLGNIDQAPSFVNGPGGDFHLLSSSPCIDTGTNSAPSLPATDFDGNNRIIDGDGDGTLIADMGVYEFVYQSPLGGGGPIVGGKVFQMNKVALLIHVIPDLIRNLFFL